MRSVKLFNARSMIRSWCAYVWKNYIPAHFVQVFIIFVATRDTRVIDAYCRISFVEFLIHLMH